MICGLPTGFCLKLNSNIKEEKNDTASSIYMKTSNLNYKEKQIYRWEFSQKMPYWEEKKVTRMMLHGSWIHSLKIFFPARSSSVKLNVSADPFFTSSPRAARISSMLPGCPNHPRWSAIRCRLLQPPHRATTTPFSYDSRQTVLTDLVSQTLQVKIMARSCLGEVFKLDKEE